MIVVVFQMSDLVLLVPLVCLMKKEASLEWTRLPLVPIDQSCLLLRPTIR